MSNRENKNPRTKTELEMTTIINISLEDDTVDIGETTFGTMIEDPCNVGGVEEISEDNIERYLTPREAFDIAVKQMAVIRDPNGYWNMDDFLTCFRYIQDVGSLPCEDFARFLEDYGIAIVCSVIYALDVFCGDELYSEVKAEAEAFIAEIKPYLEKFYSFMNYFHRSSSKENAAIIDEECYLPKSFYEEYKKESSERDFLMTKEIYLISQRPGKILNKIPGHPPKGVTMYSHHFVGNLSHLTPRRKTLLGTLTTEMPIEYLDHFLKKMCGPGFEMNTEDNILSVLSPGFTDEKLELLIENGFNMKFPTVFGSCLYFAQYYKHSNCGVYDQINRSWGRFCKRSSRK